MAENVDNYNVIHIFLWVKDVNILLFNVVLHIIHNCRVVEKAGYYMNRLGIF